MSSEMNRIISERRHNVAWSSYCLLAQNRRRKDELRDETTSSERQRYEALRRAILVVQKLNKLKSFLDAIDAIFTRNNTIQHFLSSPPQSTEDHKS